MSIWKSELVVISLTFLCRPGLSNERGDNLALNKPTEQSSNYHDYGLSSQAVDGNRNPYYIDGGSCTQTSVGHINWWMVDLQDTYLIKSVQITNRADCWERLTNVTVEVSSQHPSVLPGFPGHTKGSSTCARIDTPIPSGHTRSYDCPRLLLGRYIRVIKHYNIDMSDNSVLTLCEFEAFGLAASRYLLLTRPGSGSNVPGTIKTIPGGLSLLECARSCLSHRGGTVCLYVMFHKPTGECSLLDGYSSDVQSGWVMYQAIGAYIDNIV